ncbi:MAG: 2-phospho-L-lactate transferase [Haliangiales bacterium]
MTFRVCALSGGVGGARLVRGLAAILPPDALSVVVNTGDDFTCWGLDICPDLDTVMYTLSGLSDEQRGWGLSDERFRALAMVKRYGGRDWFQLGDRDLGTHLMRTQALADGQSLTEITGHLCRSLGIEHAILPMADQPRRTHIDTASHGSLLFQEWFVRERTQPAIEAIRFVGTDQPAPTALAALRSADLIVIGPSNPYVSIDPILTLAGVRAALMGTADDAPSADLDASFGKKTVVAVSPIVGGKAVKGPLAEMIPQLAGVAPSADAIAAHYGDLLAGFVVQRGDGTGRQAADSGSAAAPAGPRSERRHGPAILATDTIMRDRDASIRLAEEVLAFGRALG